MPAVQNLWLVSAFICMWLSSIERAAACFQVVCPYQFDMELKFSAVQSDCQAMCGFLMKESWSQLYNTDQTYKTWSGQDANKPKWKLDELERESGVCLNSDSVPNPNNLHCRCVGTVTFMRLDNGDDQKSAALADRLAGMLVQARDSGQISRQAFSANAQVNPFLQPGAGIQPKWGKKVDCHAHKHNCWCDGNGDRQPVSCPTFSFGDAIKKGQ